MRRIRLGRVKDRRLNKWYRQHKRKRLQRLRTKAEEDFEKLVNPFTNFEFKSTKNASRHPRKKYSTERNMVVESMHAILILHRLKSKKDPLEL